MSTTTAPPTSVIQWIKTVELGYSVNNSNSTSSKQEENKDCVCFYCGKSPSSSPVCKDGDEDIDGEKKITKLSKCAKCQVASYCSRECQVADWKKGDGGGHKHSCHAYKRVGPNMNIISPKHQDDARNEIFTRIRFYICPYAIHKLQCLGKGFILIQSDSTLAELSLPIPKYSNGRTMMSSLSSQKKQQGQQQQQQQQRFVLVHYLTMGEYDVELCRDDFELACVRDSLKSAVEGGGGEKNEKKEGYDEKKQVVVFMRFRCGHLAVGVAPLVPDYNVCKSLGRDYYENSGGGALQLNLDDL